MALDTLELRVCPGQRKWSPLMTESCRRPVDRSVASLTIGGSAFFRFDRELSEMDIAMARLTAGAERTEDGHLNSCCVLPVMTAPARYIRVFPRQLEARSVVVESHIFP